MIYQLESFIEYLRSSKSRFGVHSPFVYSLIKDVLKNKGRRGYPDKIEKLRSELIHDSSSFLKTDFGSGSEKGSSYEVTVRKIARYSSTSKRKGKLLYRLSDHFKPGVILEMGSALGIGTAYLASPVPHSRVITLEGCPELLRHAQHNMERLSIRNVSFVGGEFSVTLPGVLSGLDTLDMVFLDGNHREDAIVDYFELLMQYRNNDSVFIIDDIRWSAGMYKAWMKMTRYREVTVSIDLFRLGLIFFRKELSKQHFIIRY